VDNRGFNGALNTKTGTAEKTDKSLPHNAHSAICPHSSAALTSYAPNSILFFRKQGKANRKMRRRMTIKKLFNTNYVSPGRIECWSFTPEQFSFGE